MLRRPYPLLLLYCGLLFYHGLTTGELYRTEGLRARIAAECAASGNWVVPTLYGEPLFTKPPGMYAAIGLASAPFGAITDWSARLPSALAASALVFLFYWYFRRHFGPAGGLIAALLLPLSPMWLERVPTAEIDAVQTAWVGAALLFFLRALEANDDGAARSSFRWWMLALLCMAGGFLTKWTAPAFFYLTAVPLLVWRGEWRLLFGRDHLAALLLAVLVCAGWVIGAGLSTGWDVLYQTVSAEALQHLSPARQSEPYPWADAIGFPFRILAANLPLSALAVMTLRRGFPSQWTGPQARVLQAMHCWVWPNLVFWSVIPGHAVRHSMPLTPGVAGLAAIAWIGWSLSRQRLAGRLFIALIASWLLVKVAHVQFVVPPRSADRQPRAKGELLASCVPAGECLYLVGVKDEGLMFYYGGPVRRLSGFNRLPSTGEPAYCILTEAEWQTWTRSARVVRRLTDQQGDPLILIKVPTDAYRAGGREGAEGQ